MVKTFREKFSLQKRSEEASRIKTKYPDRIPVIVEKATGTDIQDIDKQKFLVPNDLTVGQFMYVIRKRLKLEPEKAVFLFVNNSLPSTTHMMSQIYNQHKDVDGFVYFLFSGENCFG